MSLNRQYISVISILFSICISLSFAGCGYRLLNTDSRQDITPVVIAVKPIINQTPDPKLDWRVTDYITKELTNWPGIKIRPYDEAEYCLSGKILSHRSQIPYTYDSRQNPLEYKISLLMSLSMSRIEDADRLSDLEKKEEKGSDFGTPIQIIPHLQEEEIYRIYSSDLGRSKLAEWQAVERAVKRMIRRAMDQFLGAMERN